MTETQDLQRDFYLIETMLWQRDRGMGTGFEGFPLLERHIARLGNSACFFGFPFSGQSIAEILHTFSARLAAKAMGNEERYKVRCVLDVSGRFEITSVDKLQDIKTPVMLDISHRTVDHRDIYLYHKTSLRELFDRERKRLQPEGLFDTILLNARGEITQGTITNIFLDPGTGVLVTPALSCGLLPGIMRQKLIEEGLAEEAVLKKEDLVKAEALYVGNSVRGLLKARVIAR